VHGDGFDPIEEAALLLYLNRTCFNGLYRENSTGDFNVPIGGYSNPDWIRADEIRAASDVLADTEICNQDWTYVLDKATPGDLVYIDPPYEPMSPTEYFNDYSAEGFGKEDQRELCEKTYELAQEGVHIIISNSGVTYGMYDEAGFYVDMEGATRSINSDGDNRDEVNEIIATNVPRSNRQTVGQQTLTEFEV
jgi:DNA adenine methylase